MDIEILTTNCLINYTGCGRETGYSKTVINSLYLCKYSDWINYLHKYSVWISYFYNLSFLCRTLYIFIHRMVVLSQYFICYM